MNTYTLRCGEVVPLGVECALPLPGRVSATRQWKRLIGFTAVGLLVGLVAFNPDIQDLLLPDVPVIAVAPGGVVLARDSLMCPP